MICSIYLIIKQKRKILHLYSLVFQSKHDLLCLTDQDFVDGYFYFSFALLYLESYIHLFTLTGDPLSIFISVTICFKTYLISYLFMRAPNFLFTLLVIPEFQRLTEILNSQLHLPEFLAFQSKAIEGRVFNLLFRSRSITDE